MTLHRPPPAPYFTVNFFKQDPDAAIELAASRWVGRFDAGMTLAENREFERWKATDPRHERAYARHEQAWRYFDRPVTAGRATVMIEALAASKATRRRRKIRHVATGLAAGVIVGLLWYQAGVEPRIEAPDVMLASNATVTMPEKRVLPDGSIVELKPGSAIDVAFDASARRVTLQWGEAFFQVAKAPEPFVVSAQGVGVRAVGTAFSVLLEGQTVDVLVTEGTVAVEETATARAEARDETKTPAPAYPIPHTPSPPVPQAVTPVLVDAGNRVQVDLLRQDPAPAAVTPVTLPDIVERLAWRKIRLEFTDTPLAVAAGLFNRHSTGGEAIRVLVDPKDAALARMEVSGYFDADNVDAFVHLIEQTLGVKADRQVGKITLVRKR